MLSNNNEVIHKIPVYITSGNMINPVINIPSLNLTLIINTILNIILNIVINTIIKFKTVNKLSLYKYISIFVFMTIFVNIIYKIITKKR
jgi:hypothetical protein